ncbi:MAG TPA: glutamate synthase large subunit [Candidatus Binatia bacterium]|jgi:glutamate synthase domain-containing protein 2/glutamate synthase domain-containing protein 1/glutamate synthase domain-containing protein 3
MREPTSQQPTSQEGKPVGLGSSVVERDACGVGFVANIRGEASHAIIETGIEVLKRLEHRGACGCDSETGDGAGVLMQIPDRLLRECTAELGFTLPPAHRYGVAMCFLPPAPRERQATVLAIESACRRAGLRPLGWRDVPVVIVDAESGQRYVGTVADSKRPHIAQLFVAAERDMEEEELERRLYIARRVAEHAIAAEGGDIAYHGYICSFSCRTIVYKGMLVSSQLDGFFPDLRDPRCESALALIHSRFSTNTLPTWRLAHPFRFLAHNGEINTLRGNINWMTAREKLFSSPVYAGDMAALLPVIAPGQSDSASFDNALELLTRTGRSLSHAITMMIPEAWEKHESMPKERRAFYQYHSSLMEPWDGPASIAFSDGRRIGAVLDRNGLRPSRYLVTRSGMVVMASETGVVDVAPEDILIKDRLQPGRIFCVDLDEKRIVTDDELKLKMSARQPYGVWLKEQGVDLDEQPPAESVDWHVEGAELERLQNLFGYSREDLSVLLSPVALNGQEPVGSMGTDTPLACLSDQPQLVFNYFKQLFAQVTNPPIDPIREELVMSIETAVGRQGNIFEESPQHCRQLRMPHPLLTNEEMAKIREIDANGIRSRTIGILFPAGSGKQGLVAALDRICDEASRAVTDGIEILILSDRGVTEELDPVPSLLAVGAVHHHLIRTGQRMLTGIVLESAEPREVMHFALLAGFGCSAVNPYLAIDTLVDMSEAGNLHGLKEEEAVEHFRKAIGKGLLKTMSKMGISTLASYRGAQIFEAIGLSDEVIERCFAWTASRIRGVGFDVLAREVEMRHERAWRQEVGDDAGLVPGGQYQWRRRGEFHLFNPETIARLQHAVRSGRIENFKAYSRLVNEQDRHLCTLRSLLEFIPADKPLSLDEVEPASEIVKRFKTGAMSFGSISREAHTTLAIAMNRIGGKSNTGEGGEEPWRYEPLPNGDSARSAIKQVASGRFGVTSAYLTNASELQIKMAQGAKPGEGGQLPGHKVDEVIAKTRFSTPGVGLISPPPHHDIYSIEDLAQLIHDLKNANPKARVSVKLVAEVGVGTIAAGVAKAKADVVLISGHDGGTGASPLSSIKHAGIPWELGLAETQQVLVENGLRSRIRIETDGQLKTGRDVAIAALLGADEFGFATAALVSTGCIMMRKCHLNTCPVGIATQDPELRKRFTGEPEHVINFMFFIAEELREIMAKTGFRTVQEMTGHVEKLRIRDGITHWKAKGIDFSPILFKPEVGPEIGISGTESQDHGLEKALDNELIRLAAPALESKKPVRLELPIRNTNRTVCTTLSHEITKRYGEEGLPPYTVQIDFEGSAGQSFAAFLARGVSLTVKGDANDYFCKGMSGGQVVIQPQDGVKFAAEDNIVIGNVALYGATGGEVFIRGRAGERFGVRNSGATAVVEGIGDHGCEYMTRGIVLVLGSTGRNFAAGMSGGIAYVLDEEGTFRSLCNLGMVELTPLDAEEDRRRVHQLLVRHVQYTKSEVAQRLLDEWDTARRGFVKVMPTEYRKVLESMNLDSEAQKLAAV